MTKFENNRNFLAYLGSIERWRLQRELKRLSMQARQVPWLLASSLIRTVYDKYKSKFTTEKIGDIHFGTNICIFLIYQPNNISESVLYTLKKLVIRGFSTIVVSNCSISDADIDRIKPLSSRIIQRPNYGYDFGGYRDGILSALEYKDTIENLLVVNDSIWFPLKDNCNFLSQILQQNKDLYGLVMNARDKNPKRHHIQSYLFNFKGRVVRSEAFHNYWQHLFLSNNKLAVVRQCEIKMSEYFREKGFTVGARFSMNDIYRCLKQLNNQEFCEVIDYQIQIDRKNKQVLETALASGINENRMSLIERGYLGKSLIIAHPLLLAKIGFPALKRDKQYVNVFQRRTLLRLGLQKGFAETQKIEIERRDKPENLSGNKLTVGNNDGI